MSPPTTKKTMPRPKSNITGRRPKNLSVRWTEDQHIAYLRLGGSSWLRAAVDAEIKKHGGVAAIPPRKGANVEND